MRAQPSLSRNLMVLASGEAVTRVFTFIGFVHLARALTPSVYGLVELTLATMTFLTLGVEHGSIELGAREVARAPRRVEPLAGRVVSSQLLVALGLYALLVPIVLALPLDARLRPLLLGYGVSLLGLPFLLGWLFQGRSQMGWVALLQGMRPILFTIAVLLWVRAPEDVLRLPAFEIASVGAAGIIGIILLRRGGERLRLGLDALRDPQPWRESLPIGGSKLIWAVRMYLPMMILSASAGSAAVGLFGAAHRIQLVGQLMLNVYFTAVFPTISLLAYDSTEALTRFLRGSVRLSLWPLIAGATVVSGLAPTIMRVLFGGAYLRPEASTTLAVLIWLVPIFAWRRHGRIALIALNRQRDELWCSLAGLALLVVLAVLLSRRYAAVGTATAMVSAELLTSALTWWRLRHYLPGLRWVRELLGVPSLQALDVHSGA